MGGIGGWADGEYFEYSSSILGRRRTYERSLICFFLSFFFSKAGMSGHFRSECLQSEIQRIHFPKCMEILLFPYESVPLL